MKFTKQQILKELDYYIEMCEVLNGRGKIPNSLFYLKKRLTNNQKLTPKMNGTLSWIVADIQKRELY